LAQKLRCLHIDKTKLYYTKGENMINEFINYQEEYKKNEEIPLTNEEFQIALDMLSLEDNTEDIEFSLEGLGITKSGKVVFTNKEDIKYQKALVKQRQKNRLKLIRGN
jgi:hypothetical protein